MKILKLVCTLMLLMALAGCGPSNVVRLYDSTYTVSAQYGSLNGSWTRASQEAFERATSFCERKNLKFVFVNEQRDGVLGWSPQVSTVTFKCEVHKSFADNSAEEEKKSAINSENKLTDNDGVRLSVENFSNTKQKADSVAIIIGIQNYKRLAKADFADQDAVKFAEYAHRGLGIPKNKIKVLTETDADQAALLKIFRNWLPLNVNKGKTEVFVFYSGHGLPSVDGKSLYFLPHGVDQDLLDETAIDQRKIIAAIQSTQPKSVTMFIDSCYSGQSRNGSQLLAGAKPVTLKNTDIGYPPEFTVFTASAADQISSASNDLQHGIFSFYLMKGMEGAADINKDGNITFGEMQQYLSENVQRQALAANRVQVPQLIGDANRVLVGR